MPGIDRPTIEDLVDRMRDVSVIPELLRQRYDIRQATAENVTGPIRIEVHTCRIRSQPGEQTESRRRTERDLTVVCLKECSTRCQLVDIGRPNPLRPVAAQQRFEVIRDDEEDVGLFDRRICREQ